MKLSLILMLLCLHATMLLAQPGILRGQVLDAGTQQPLPFANVYLNRTTIGTTTNETGEFTLTNVPVGLRTVVVSTVGFFTQSLPVSVNDSVNAPIRVLLTPTARQMAEVSVKASRDKTWEKQRR